MGAARGLLTLALAGLVLSMFADGLRSHRLRADAPAVSAERGCRRADRVVKVRLSARRWPAIADHVADVDQRFPRVLHLDRAGADANREASLRDVPTRPGFDRDEYPPAASREGGAGADVRYVVSSENRSAGSYMVAGLSAGAPVSGSGWWWCGDAGRAGVAVVDAGADAAAVGAAGGVAVSPDQLRGSAYTLARELRVTIHEHEAVGQEDACCHVEARVVDVLPIVDATSYLICLHELAHVAVPSPVSGGRGCCRSARRGCGRGSARSCRGMRRRGRSLPMRSRRMRRARACPTRCWAEYLAVWMRVATGLPAAMGARSMRSRTTAASGALTTVVSGLTTKILRAEGGADDSKVSGYRLRRLRPSEE